MVARAPLQRVLVATDLSPGADRALARAVALPLASGAELRLLHVMRSGRGGEPDRGAERALAERVARVVSAFGERGVRVTSSVVHGRPFVEIIRGARQLGAELTVVGRRGAGAAGDGGIGTTAQRVVRKGDVPVLAVARDPKGPYRTPLVATDLTDATRNVIETALRIVAPEVAHIHVVHAVHVPFEGFVSPLRPRRTESDYQRSIRSHAEQRLAALLASYEADDVRWNPIVREGDARTVVAFEAVERGADLLALGTHGRSGLSHVLLGSVAEWMLAQAACDVLVARPIRFAFELP